MGAGKGKRVMGGGGPMSQTAQQAELKLEQMVDQRDMAIANATVNGDSSVEAVTNQEILPISEVHPAGPTSALPLSRSTIPHDYLTGNSPFQCFHVGKCSVMS